MGIGFQAWDTIVILVGGISTLAIFSFLVAENRFYRFFEHLFIGVSTGLGLVVSVKSFLWPKILQPMLGLDIVTFPDGTHSKPYNTLLLLYLLPLVFGMLYYFIYSKRYNWLAKLVIGFSLGMSGGIAFKGFFNEMMPQVFGTFKPLIVFAAEGVNWRESIENCVFILTLLAVMYYFFFSFRTDGPVAKRFSLLGRWLMMVSFGAFFGSTVMARMALLVERLQFLIFDWWGAIRSLI